MFQWTELSTAYHLEARWYHGEYVPTLDEYLSTAWISISGPILLFHAYFTMADPISKNELESLEQNSGIIHWPSMVLRLTDDLGTTSVCNLFSSDHGSIYGQMKSICTDKFYSFVVSFCVICRMKSRKGMFRNQFSVT